jgi:hypothetical protein
MLGRIGVHRLVRPAVNGEIGLPVSVQVQRAHHHAAFHRLLVDPGRDPLAFPDHFPWKPDVYRNDLHGGNSS